MKTLGYQILSGYHKMKNTARNFMRNIILAKHRLAAGRAFTGVLPYLTE